MPRSKAEPLRRLLKSRRSGKNRGSKEYKPLEAVLGYSFRDVSLLRQALTHSSWTNQHPGDPHNERLEFLGDSVLQLAVTSHIFDQYLYLAEGKLSKIRAEVVSGVPLRKIAQEIKLETWLRTESSSIPNLRDSSIMANAIEALIGAVYLDGGWKAARKVVLTLVEHQIQLAAAKPGGKDSKSLLQEQVSKESGTHPQYLVVSQGSSASPHFMATVSIYGEELGRGEGNSKKQAEQEAARDALYELGVL